MLIQGSIASLATEANDEPTDAEYDYDYESDYYENYDEYIPDVWDDSEYGDFETDDLLPEVEEGDELESEEDDDELEYEYDYESESLDDYEDEPSEESIEDEETTILQRTGVTVIDNVDFYREPDAESEHISQIAINTNVRMTGRRDTWYRIDHDGEIGWVKRSNIQRTHQMSVVYGNDVPVHIARSDDAEILTYVEHGARLTVSQRTSGWGQVTVNGYTGWIRNNQLRTTNGRRPGRATNAINLHLSPTESSTVIQELPLHQELMILQRTTNGDGENQGWTQVEIRHSEGMITGWICTEQVERRNQTRRTRGIAEISVRTGPGLSYGEDGRISTDTRVRVLAEAGSWSRVRFSQNGVDQYGWISNSGLTRIDIRQTSTRRHTGVTVVNNVNFRRGPSTDYAILRRIPVNTNVRITGRRGTWYRIVHNDTTGWVERSSTRRTIQTAVVRSNNVPVRNARSSDARILTHASRGTRVTITQRTPRWARVTVNGRTGWIRTNQIRTTNGRRPGRTTGQVNLHSRPNASSTVSRRLSRHQDIMILQRTTNGNSATQGWTQVIVVDGVGGTDTGWIRTDRVERRTQRRRTGGARQISVRTGPGSRFSRISRAGRIPRNTSVTVIAEIGNWSHVRFNYNGRRHYGWIRNRNILPIFTVHHNVERTLRRMVDGRRTIGISYLCLITGRHISVNGNRNFFAASTIKLPTHMMAAEAVRDGNLSWSQRLTIRQDDIIGGSGILQHWVRPGDRITLYELMRHSIVYSDNTGHRRIVRALLPNSTHQGMELTHAVFNRYLPGQTPQGRSRLTPNQLTEIFRVLYRDRNNIAGYGTIIDYMMNTSWTDRFYTSLTSGYVAHTPGWTHPFQHDSGIFFTEHPYVLVVMTEGAGGVRFLSEVANAVFRIHREFE